MGDWKKLARQSSERLKPRTLVELWGRERVLVEHHRGIRAYGDQEIRVGATYGMILVRGSGLRLCCMSREQLFISGKIHCVEMEEQ